MRISHSNHGEFMRQPLTRFVHARLPEVRPGKTIRDYRIGRLLGAGGFFRATLQFIPPLILR